MSAATTGLFTGRRPMPEVETRTSDDGTLPVTPDVACLQDLIVNVVFGGYPGDRWVLVDAGMPDTAAKIEHAAEP